MEKGYQISDLTLDGMAHTCDRISLYCPAAPETSGMINSSFLNKMKPDAYIIHTARGEMSDNQAFYEAITTEKIRGAGSDTVAPEPTASDNILLNLPPAYVD